MKNLISRLLIVGITVLSAMNLCAAELTIAAASDLKFAMDELIGEFRSNRPATTIKVTYGSSGNFFAQIQNRAPFDLYFSADIDYPSKLAAAGHALDTNVFLYAIGRIVLWTPKSSTLDVEKLGIQSLLDPTAKKIAIANPQHAPYGRAAIAALKSLGVHSQVEAKLVHGENIAQTAQFVQTGAADVGIVALGLALAPQMRSNGKFWEVPVDAYPKMAQGGMIVSWTREPQAAREFRDFVLGAQGRSTLKRFGFFLPEK